MKNTWSIYVILIALAVLAGGCLGPAHHPDPLAGWHFCSLTNLDDNVAISNDYRRYIQQLSPEERKYLGPSPIDYFEDGTGQHAVRITIGLKGTVWRYILIYDKNNKRIKTIKYASGGYRS